MIYLIEDRDYLKIGYAADVKARMKQYKTHSLYPTLIAQKPGGSEDEKRLHKLCSQWNVENEWFQNCQEVKDIFNSYEPSFNIEKLKQIVCHNVKELEHTIKTCQYKNPKQGVNLRHTYLTNSQQRVYYELMINKLLTAEWETWMTYYNNINRIFLDYNTFLYPETNYEYELEYFFNRTFHVKVEFEENQAKITINHSFEEAKEQEN